MLHLSEWEAKAWLAVLSGVIVGCVATIWMAVENEIDHYYRPTMDEVHLVAEDAGVGDCPETHEFDRVLPDRGREVVTDSDSNGNPIY